MGKGKKKKKHEPRRRGEPIIKKPSTKEVLGKGPSGEGIALFRKGKKGKSLAKRKGAAMQYNSGGGVFL